MTYILGTPIGVSPKLITLISQIVIPKDTPPVISITTRNKMEGLTHGNWGRFYPDTYTISLCVPREISDLVRIAKYSRFERRFRNKLDFVAVVLGHELYHAWQWHNHQDLWHCTEWLEVEAERYESLALEKWNKYLEENKVFERAVASSSDIKG